VNDFEKLRAGELSPRGLDILDRIEAEVERLRAALGEIQTELFMGFSAKEYDALSAISEHIRAALKEEA